jgi:hypothetical protein
MVAAVTLLAVTPAVVDAQTPGKMKDDKPMSGDTMKQDKMKTDDKMMKDDKMKMDDTMKGDKAMKEEKKK